MKKSALRSEEVYLDVILTRSCVLAEWKRNDVTRAERREGAAGDRRQKREVKKEGK